ncbi:MAG TPA: metallopeptidase TldD-related protein, partial [Elusimicrobiales bacterium]|nr:metallopeptidase TldD-related protein [Elusimicrobiales bacterium]
YFLNISSMPTVAQLEREADNLGAAVSALYDSGTLDAYIGPVLLEGGSAGDFLYHLFVSNVSSPREEWLENGVDDRMGLLAPKMGLRVLPAFIDVYDDAAETLWSGQPLIGGYRVDDEGVPPQRLELVRRGKLMNVYTGRAPVKGRPVSNGHGRSSWRSFPAGQAGNVFVSARRESGCVLPAVKLRQRLVKMCRELELEYGILIRAFDSFSRDSYGYEARFSAYKIYAADGREEPVHGLEISGLTPADLRGIEAVSSDRTVASYLRPVPVSIVSPALLLGDVEVKKSLLKPDRLPYLKNPYFSEKPEPGPAK